MKQYSAKYFYNKFEAIPEEKWCVGTRTDHEGKHCALGHLSEYDTTPGIFALGEILGQDDGIRGREEVVNINNGPGVYLKFGATPRQRILNALRSKMLEGAAIK